MPDTLNLPVAWVDRQADLDAVIARLQGCPRVGFDTEFHGERTYFPHLMLLQLAFDDGIVLVDPLADVDIGGLFAAMRDSGALIVGHALHNDLEIVASVFGVHFSRLFDTQIAAAFCGHGLQIGLSGLLHAELDRRLPKGAQLADWSRRPLPDRQMVYAADDVRHLAALHDALARSLQARGREAWVAAECDALCEPSRYGRDPEEAWQRISGGRKLPPRELGVLCALAAERDAISREVDTVPHFLVPDEVLLSMARHVPADREALLADRRMGHRNVGRHADRWLQAVRRGLQAPLVLPSGRPPPEAGVEAVAGLLMLMVNELAAREGVAAQLVLKRRQVIEALQDGCDGGGAMMERLGLEGWRRELVGDAVRRLLQGQTQAAVHCAEDGALGLLFVEQRP